MTAESPSLFADRIDGEGFAEWYRERQFAHNVQNGQSYFNGPSSVPPPDRHTPSSLLQCQRKVFYRKENAPAERTPPEGIFWTGRRFEEELIVPFLRDTVGSDAYVRNSIWVDFEVDAGDEPLRIRGTTDPCVVDPEGTPVLPTEVKTKDDVRHLEQPNRHHRAQVHAYMRGLSHEFDRDVDEAILIYGGRKTLDVRVFREPFDPEFWGEVIEWAASLTEHREVGHLPPAEPEYDWECRFCDYQHRCGMSDRAHTDEGPEGFLPGLEYPRECAVEYLESHPGAKLTPTLARTFQDLADEYEVHDWTCSRNGCVHSWTDVDDGSNGSEGPVCPACADRDVLATLSLDTLDGAP